MLFGELFWPLEGAWGPEGGQRDQARVIKRTQEVPKVTKNREIMPTLREEGSKIIFDKKSLKTLILTLFYSEKLVFWR